VERPLTRLKLAYLGRAALLEEKDGQAHVAGAALPVVDHGQLELRVHVTIVDLTALGQHHRRQPGSLRPR
jgi:hypothetical protein